MSQCPDAHGPRSAGTPCRVRGGHRRSRGAPLGLAGDSRAALRRHRRRPDRAGRGGQLDACPTACRSEVMVERPKSKEHGDYATNVALQLAKKAGIAPARARRSCWPSELADDRRHRVGRHRRARASSTSGRRRRAGRGRRRRGRGRRGVRHAARRCAGTHDQPGVRLRQPDRPAPPRPHPLGRRRRRARPGARRGRRRGHPRVLHQRPRHPDGPVRRLARGRARMGEPVPEDGYHGDYIDDLAARIVAEHPGIARAARATSGWSRSARPATSSSSPSSRPQLERFRTHFDVWFSERSPARRAARSSTAREAARAGPPLRGRRRALAAHHRLRRRQGPGADPVQRRADLLRLRHRLLPRQARARLRRLHLPARRRPPRLRRPAARRWPPAPATTRDVNIEVLIGQLVKILPGRRGGAAVQAGRHDRHAGASWSTRSASTPLRYSLARYPADSPLTLDIDRDDAPGQRQPGLLRAVRPRPARLDPAQRGRPRAGRRRRRSTPRLLAHEKEGDLLRALAEFPRVVAAAAELREPHRVARYLEDTAGDVPPVLRRLPGAAAGRRGGRPTCTAPGCCWSRPPAWCSPTASACSASRAPERM